MVGDKDDPFIVQVDPKGKYHIIENRAKLRDLMRKNQEAVWIRVTGEKQVLHVHVSKIANKLPL